MSYSQELSNQSQRTGRNHRGEQGTLPAGHVIAQNRPRQQDMKNESKWRIANDKW
jgi:hypothetical protein